VYEASRGGEWTTTEEMCLPEKKKTDEFPNKEDTEEV
jgi:hypothetical protein